MASTIQRRWAEHATHRLTRSGYRAGAARAAVVDALAEQSCCRSAREIHDTMREAGSSVGIASVYRALEVLDELRLVQRLDAGEGVVRYEPAHAGGDHHHHIVCDACGSVASYEDEELERAIGHLAQKLSWNVDSHAVVLRGRCPRCAAT